MIRPSLALAAALSIAAFAAAAPAATLPGPDWNASPDPDAPVGLCHVPGGSESVNEPGAPERRVKRRPI